MDKTSWILFGIFILCLSLYYVFTFVKNIKIIQIFSSITLLPIIGILTYRFLVPFIPDSYHMIKITIYSFTCISLTQIFDSVLDNKSSHILQGIFYILSTLLLWDLFKSVFYIYRVESIIHIISLSSYIIVFLLFYLIFVKKQSFLFYIFAVTGAFFTSLLHYSSLVSLCTNPINYNITKFIGATILLGYVIFQTLCNSRINLKLKKLISLTTLLASQILFALSNLMILY